MAKRAKPKRMRRARRRTRGRAKDRKRLVARRSVRRPRKAPTRRRKPERLDRVRRTLSDERASTPPSSLNLDRSSSAARSGRRVLNARIHEHPGMTPALTGGDVDADWENAYFSGEEAPGGDNPTPDQEVVDDIGRALGVEYQDAEELKGSDKVTERDRHRWELDPASSEDYKERR